MSETIGKVVLDTRYYHSDDQYSDGDATENRLLEIVSTNPRSEYPKITTQEASWPILYHLSPIRENILNWVPIQAGQHVLELGSGCGAVTGALLGKGAKVTAVDLSLRRSRINATRHRDCDDLNIVVGASEEVLPQLEERFDHITLIGVLEYAGVFSDAEKPYHQILGLIRDKLKDDGALWVAIENKLGLKYFAGCREDHTGRYFESIEDYSHRDGAYTFSRRELMALARECGYECSFYYPYPDYKLPVKVFSDDYLPQKGELNRNWQNFDADRIALFDESKAFDTVLDAGLFPELANSFLVKLVKRRGDADERVVYSKASVERKPEYCQQTLIMQAGERRWVRKIAVGEAAKGHLKDYGRNLEKLTASLKPGSQVNMIPCREGADGAVEFPFLTDPTLSQRLIGLDPQAYLRSVRQFLSALTDSFETQPFEAGEAFRDFFGVVPEFEDAPALTVANADLNFDNVFCLPDGGYTIIDYEWVLPFPIPISFLTYRSLMLDPAFNAFPEETRVGLLAELGISEALRGQYHEMEMAFLRYISPDEYKLDYFARVPDALPNVVYSFDHVTKLLEEKQKLAADLDREVKHALYLSGKLKEEQATIARLNGELIRENREAVRLSGELKRELGVSQSLSQELARHIDLYNEFSGKLWFKVLRRLSRGNRKIIDALRRVAQKNRFLWKGWKGLSYLLHRGPAALARKLLRMERAETAQKQFVERLLNPQAEQEKDPPIPEDIRFSLLVPLYNTPEAFLREMIQSVLDQTYSNWELCLADGSDSQHPEVGAICQELAAADSRIVYRRLEHNGGISENTNACIDMATGDYIALFDHDDLLHPKALYENARAIHEQGSDYLYSDEVVFASPDKTDLIATHFKPDYSPESLLSNNYICHLSVFKRSLLEEAGPFRKDFDGSQDHDIILRLTDRARNVTHIPKVLYFWRSHPTSVASDIGSKTYAIDAGRNAVRDFLRTKRGVHAAVESTPEYPTMYHVQFPIDGEPAVDVILDWTGRDQSRAALCLQRLCARMQYARASFIVITDEAEPGSDFAGAANAYSKPVAWVQTGERNRAKRLNEAARRGQGDFLVFLDAELEGEGEDWVEQLLMLAQQERIGAVGGKIYFTNHTLRQGGLILGLGGRRLVGRSHFLVERGNGGYFGQLAIVGDVSAVSLECMMLRRDRFEAVGGFDEAYQDSLFDVDLCLKLTGAGYRNLYTPFALFTGGEAGDYSIDYAAESGCYPQDSERLRCQWNEQLSRTDPYYNPNLTLDHSDYSVKP